MERSYSQGIVRKVGGLFEDQNEEYGKERQEGKACISNFIEKKDDLMTHQRQSLERCVR